MGNGEAFCQWAAWVCLDHGSETECRAVWGLVQAVWIRGCPAGTAIFSCGRFSPFEVFSSVPCRGLVAHGSKSGFATRAAFQYLDFSA